MALTIDATLDNQTFTMTLPECFAVEGSIPSAAFLVTTGALPPTGIRLIDDDADGLPEDQFVRADCSDHAIAYALEPEAPIGQLIRFKKIAGSILKPFTVTGGGAIGTVTLALGNTLTLIKVDTDQWDVA